MTTTTGFSPETRAYVHAAIAAAIREHGSVAEMCREMRLPQTPVHRFFKDGGTLSPSIAAAFPPPASKPRIRVKAISGRAEPAISYQGHPASFAAEYVRRRAALIAPALHLPQEDQDADEETGRPRWGGTTAPPEVRTIDLPGRRFFLSAAQNNTRVPEHLLASIKTFCASRDCQLLVGRLTYATNKFASKKGGKLTTKDDETLVYDHSIEEFLCDHPVRLAPSLVFVGSMDISPTATDPLSGLDAYTGEASGVFPHTKVRMKTLATMKSHDARELHTTGALTLRNYVQRKAGQKAEFHHVYGGLYVEVDPDGTWFARQVTAGEDGILHDMDERFSPEGVTKVPVSAVTWGDFHAEKIDDKVFAACFTDEGSIYDTLKPGVSVIHDLFDQEARNHHNLNDSHFWFAQHTKGTASVEGGIAAAAALAKKVDEKGGKVLAVTSNHDRALLRWVKEGWNTVKTDPINLRYWHRLNLVCLDAIESGSQDFNLFEFAIREKVDLPNTIFLDGETSYRVHGIELGLHGDLGANGAKGSPRSFRQMGVRTNSGHTHAAQILDGAYVAGVTGKMDMGYNVGLSGWTHSHILVYANGKRAILTVHGKRWRGAPLTPSERGWALQLLAT